MPASRRIAFASTPSTSARGRSRMRGAASTGRIRFADKTCPSAIATSSRPDGHRLKDAVRRQVRFQQGISSTRVPARAENLRHDVLPQPADLFRPSDAGPRRERPAAAVGVDGNLFVAPSETGLLLSHAFESTRVPLAFAFRMPSAGPRAPTPRLADPVAAVQGPRRTVRAATPSATARPRQARTRTAQPPIPSPAQPRSALDAGLRLADQGRFREASSCYEQHVREHGPSAEAYHLMGLVQDAGGNQSVAAECYRKALYLDPQHHDTLIHLALLVEEQGHAVQGQVLRDRAQRANVAGRIQVNACWNAVGVLGIGRVPSSRSTPTAGIARCTWPVPWSCLSATRRRRTARDGPRVWPSPTGSPNGRRVGRDLPRWPGVACPADRVGGGSRQSPADSFVAAPARAA